MLDGNPMFLNPFHQLFTDVFGTIVDPNGARLATPFDDAIQTADDTFGGKREVDLDAEALTIEIVQNVQQPECSAIPQSVGHEVHGPSHIGCIWHRQGFRLIPLSGLDAQVCKHPLQPAVLFLHGLHLADHGRIHAAILRPLFVERRIAHAMFAAQLGHWHTAFSLAQDRKNLGFAISGHLHLNLLVHLAEKTLLPHPFTFGGITHEIIVIKHRFEGFADAAVDVVVPCLKLSATSNSYSMISMDAGIKSTVGKFVFRMILEMGRGSSSRMRS